MLQELGGLAEMILAVLFVVAQEIFDKVQKKSTVADKEVRTEMIFV